MLQGKRILVGITAGIAAYKVISLVRLLRKEGAEVRVMLTPGAHEFVTPLTLATLSDNPVVSDFTVSKTSGEWTNHVEWGMWGDLMVIAPLTANSMAKMCSGEADNFLLATYLSAKCPVLVAPAMDLDMHAHESTQENLKTLETRGVSIVPAETGALASGLSGQGRMAEPETIFNHIRVALFPANNLTEKRILITAGPTHEPIDPVRFLANRATGTMGYRLAESAARLGMKVTLISGPTHAELSTASVELVQVTTASEMLEACTTHFEKVDITIMAAAVADYTPAEFQTSKIKKGGGDWSLSLKRTTDILKTLGEQKRADQLLVGFALETDNEEANARDKMARKNLDFIVLNSLNDKGAGFGQHTNKITLFDAHNNVTKFELKSKAQVAEDILQALNAYYEAD